MVSKSNVIKYIGIKKSSCMVLMIGNKRYLKDSVGFAQNKQNKWTTNI